MGFPLASWVAESRPVAEAGVYRKGYRSAPSTSEDAAVAPWPLLIRAVLNLLARA